MEQKVLVDPLSLIFSGPVYIKWTLPDPPPVDVLRRSVRESVRTMAPADRERALAGARALGVYARTMEEELARTVRPPRTVTVPVA